MTELHVQIFDLLRDGCNPKQIAEQLHYSPAYIKQLIATYNVSYNPDRSPAGKHNLKQRCHLLYANCPRIKTVDAATILMTTTATVRGYRPL